MLTRGPVRRPAEAAAARSGTLAGHGCAAGPLHQRHDHGHDRRSRLLEAACFTAEPAHDEVISRPDSNDTRMQQVMYANGKLWGALDTALNPDGGPQRAGIAWYIVNPERRKVVKQGYLGATRIRLHVPGDRRHRERPRRDGVHRHRDTLNPERRVRADRRERRRRRRGTFVDPAAPVPPQDDGFTSYKSQVGNPPRTRWGDYGAAAVDGNSIWIASEYIASACNYTVWGGPFFVDGRATTCWARARAQVTAPAHAPRSATGRRGSAS